MGHIELARWADLVLIAPATADFIATMVHGRANSLLNAIYLATPAIVAVAPAMNQGMWSHPATTANMEQLSQRQVKIFGPDSGIQACGDIGLGRMQQPDMLVEQVSACFASLQLSGKKLVITAGPTREAIDPVRYISNHSSGKMGYALAEAAIEAGAEVTLISGPVNLEPPQRCTLIPVISAADMHSATMNACAGADILIAAAAVADYRPATIAAQKMKKHADAITLELEKNVDIVSAAASEYKNLFVVGFAAETQDVESYARGKLERKGLDAIVANDVSRSDVGFNSDNNEAWWISANTSKTFSIRSKTQLARDIVAAIVEQLG
jgi:phosphopantothenoylcysteine decarboxylase/phosphopantothenate--cysteine ligase